MASAAKARTINMGYFYRREAELIASYAKRIAPIQRFVRLGGTPMLQTSKGTVSLLPVDYLIWTPQLADLAMSANRDRDGQGGGEFWITGKASPMASAKLSELRAARLGNLQAQLLYERLHALNVFRQVAASSLRKSAPPR